MPHRGARPASAPIPSRSIDARMMTVCSSRSAAGRWGVRRHISSTRSTRAFRRQRQAISSGGGWSAPNKKEALVAATPVAVGIVGLGRWAKVLTRASLGSDALEDRRRLQPLGGESRGLRAGIRHRGGARPRRHAGRPRHRGRHPHGARTSSTCRSRAQVAAAGKHVYTEKPIASTLEDGLEIEALERLHGVTVTVGHSARLMAGIRAHPRGDRRRRARPRRLHRGQFLQRARARAHAHRPGAGTRTRRRAARSRSSPSTSSTCCTTSAARSSRRARWPPSSRRSAPRSTTSR